MSATVGYVRVSTRQQHLDRQHDALTDSGLTIDKVFEDKSTGRKFDRVGLNALLDYVRPGDVVVVASLDRLGRSLSEVIRVAGELQERGVILKTLKEGIDYSTSTGRMLAGIFGALAEYEVDLTAERAADARSAAAARGKQTGRPKALTDDQARQLRSLHAGGESVADLCRSFKVSRATAYRVLEDVAAQA
jgi:DNA invertase Pin-like site-specific DNA recombinase